MIVETEDLHNREKIRETTGQIFDALCGEHPGAVVIRHSGKLFEELRDLDDEEARVLLHGAGSITEHPLVETGHSDESISRQAMDDSDQFAPERSASGKSGSLRKMPYDEQDYQPEEAIDNRGPQYYGHLIDSSFLIDFRPDITLRNDYQEAMERANHANNEYQGKVRSLLQSFPQGDGEAPSRPTPEQMHVLFKKVLYSDQPRPHGKGSKGGVKHFECEWPACRYKGTLQKCMDHFFYEHVKLKFFKCDQPDWWVLLVASIY
jgi:hypothetical protein